MTFFNLNKLFIAKNPLNNNGIHTIWLNPYYQFATRNNPPINTRHTNYSAFTVFWRHHIFFSSVRPEARRCEICATSCCLPNPISRTRTTCFHLIFYQHHQCTSYSIEMFQNMILTNKKPKQRIRKGWGRNPIHRTVHANSTQPVRRVELNFIYL